MWLADTLKQAASRADLLTRALSLLRQQPTMIARPQAITIKRLLNPATYTAIILRCAITTKRRLAIVAGWRRRQPLRRYPTGRLI